MIKLPITLQAIGADPEVFFKTKDGRAKSVEGLLGGTKDEPKKVAELGEGFAVQEDNVAAEYNIPPSKTAEEFSGAIAKGLKYLQSEAAKRDLELAIVPDLDFPVNELMTPHAQTLGCDPDFNAWTMKENERPEPPFSLRTAAGHVHVSWQNPDRPTAQAIVKTLDVILGLPSILATEPNRRRTLYGKAGACRFKPYGVEYRTLDNFWLPYEAWRQHVYYSIQQAISFINRRPITLDEFDTYGEEIQQAINTHDRKLAQSLMAKWNVQLFPKLATKEYELDPPPAKKDDADWDKILKETKPKPAKKKRNPFSEWVVRESTGETEG